MDADDLVSGNMLSTTGRMSSHNSQCGNGRRRTMRKLRYEDLGDVRKLELHLDRLKIQVGRWELLVELLRDMGDMKVDINNGMSPGNDVKFRYLNSGTHADVYTWNRHPQLVLHMSTNSAGNEQDIIKDIIRIPDVRDLHHIPVLQVTGYLPVRWANGGFIPTSQIWISLREKFTGPTLDQLRDLATINNDATLHREIDDTLDEYHNILANHGLENPDAAEFNFWVDYANSRILCFDYGSVYKI